MSEENAFGLAFHRLGLAVRRPDHAVCFLGGLGYAVAQPVFDPEQNVNLIMCRHSAAMPDIEIIYPAAGRSPVDTLVERRPDGIVYHVCYVTADLAASLAGLEERGLRAVCVAEPAPAILFGGRRVSFWNIVGIGLCEIIEGQDEAIG